MNNNLCIYVGKEILKEINALNFDEKKKFYKELRNFIRTYLSNIDFASIDAKELQELEEKIAELRKKLEYGEMSEIEKNTVKTKSTIRTLEARDRDGNVLDSLEADLAGTCFVDDEDFIK